MRVTEAAEVRALFDLGPDSADLASRIADSGALIRGHFRLQSGAHAPYFLRVGQLALRAENADAIAAAWIANEQAVASRGLVILAAETSPRYLAEALSERLAAPRALAAVDGQRRPTRQLRDGSLAEAARVLIVTDVVSTGASIEPLVQLAREHTRRVSVVAVAAQGSMPLEAVEARLGVPSSALARARWQTASDGECALCRDRVPLLPAFEFN